MSFLDFSEMPMDKQIAIGMILPFIPVLIGETLFFYLLIAGQMSIVSSFGISLGFSSFGLMLWYMWRDGVRAEILEFEPINAQLFWSKEIVTWENQMITGKKELNNAQILRPVTYDDEALPRFEDPPTYHKQVIRYSTKAKDYIEETIEIPYKPKKVKVGLNEIHVGNKEIIENFLVGWRCAEVDLHHTSFSPDGMPYRKMQFIHNFPYTDDFYMCNDQFVVHQAQVLSGSSSVNSSIFLYWGERGEPIPVFLVGFSPAHADLIQLAIGIKPQLKIQTDPLKTAEEVMALIQTSLTEKNVEDLEMDKIQKKVEEILLQASSPENEKIGKKLRMEIENAINLGDKGEAMHYAQLLKQRTLALQSRSDTQKDSVEIGLGHWNYWDENLSEIEDIKPMIDFSDWRVIVGIFFSAVILSGIVYWLVFR